MWKEKNWIPLLGGLTALVGFFLPFDQSRSPFHILENDPLPFFSPLLVLLLVLTMLLRQRRPFMALLLGVWLLLSWLFLLGLLLWVFSPAVLVKALGPGGFLLSLDLPVMSLCPT